MNFNRHRYWPDLRPILSDPRWAATAFALLMTGCQPDSSPSAKPPSALQLAEVDSPSPTPTEAGPAYATTRKEPGQPALTSVSGNEKPTLDKVANSIDVKPERKLWLGIQAEPAPKVLLDQFDLQCGLVVTKVVKGAPSDGLLYPSDVICRFNGRELACQKRLCAMIADAGTLTCRLTVIRKMKPLEVEIMPQPVEYLPGGQIAQYTILADQNSVGLVDMPRAQDRVAEKLRLFVVQPILVVDEASGRQKPASDEQADQLVLERVVSFGQNEKGQPIVIVQEAERTLNYTVEEIQSACPEVQQLWELIANRQ